MRSMLDKNLIASKAIEAGTRLTVKSALNPILWLCAIITLPSVAAVAYLPSPPNWMIAMTIAPVATAIFGFVFLLLFDRDKLQSEEYQLKKQSLEMIQEKGDNAPRIVPIDEIDALAETSRPALSAHAEDAR